MVLVSTETDLYCTGFIANTSRFLTFVTAARGLALEATFNTKTKIISKPCNETFQKVTAMLSGMTFSHLADALIQRDLDAQLTAE